MTPVAAATSKVGMAARKEKGKGKQRIAVIGTGLAGLTSSYLLTEDGRTRDQFDVHLFERNSSFGLDASSMNAENGKRVDVPMRSVNGGYYPNLVKLYKQLRGVHLRETNFTYSFSANKQRASDQPFLLYNGMNGIRGVSMPSPIPKHASLFVRSSLFFRQSRLLLLFVISYLSLLALSLYHHSLGHLLDSSHPLTNTPMHVYLRKHKRSIHPAFVELVLYATFSAVTTSSYADVKNLPMAEVMVYVATTFGRSHYAVQGGVERVESALTEHVNLDNVHLGCSVDGLDVDATTGQATIVIQTAHGDRQRIDGFDHVILACPASFSVRLLQSYTESLHHLAPSDSSSDKHRPFGDEAIRAMQTTRRMQECLSKVPYVHNSVINHTDFSLLPDKSSFRRDLNIVVVDCPASGTLPSAASTRTTIATHMIQLDQDAPVILQTTYSASASSSSNATDASIHLPAKSKVVSEATFTRATTPASSKQTLSGLFEWRQEAASESFFFRLLHYLFQDQSPDLKTDWITSIRYVLCGRRSIMTLGPLQRAQRLSSSRTFTTDDDTPARSEDLTRLPCIWTCGSYAQGIPLLEGCVTSSTLIVNEIIRQGRDVPSLDDRTV